MTRFIAVRFLIAFLTLVVAPWAVVFGIWSVFTTGVFNGLALVAALIVIVFILAVIFRDPTNERTKP